MDVSSSFGASPVDKNLQNIIKGKEVKVESQAKKHPVEETPLFETLKGSKHAHTRPTNKLRFKIKLRSNPNLDKEVIDVENMPSKELIINKINTIGSKKTKDKATKGKGPVETWQRKR